MLDEARVAVILDGLDEISQDLRPAVLRALSQQATFRLILLTRNAEMAEAATRALLQGAAAIELQDLGPDTAVCYLTRTQLDPPLRGWQELTSRLRQEPGSPLAQALNNPLMLTLIRDTYRAGDDVRELLSLRDAAGHPASSDDITGHLLDRVLPAAYTPQPGEPLPRYDRSTAERAAMHRHADEQRGHQGSAMVARAPSPGSPADRLRALPAAIHASVSGTIDTMSNSSCHASSAALRTAWSAGSIRWRRPVRRH